MGFTKSVTLTFVSNMLLFLLSIITTTILSRMLGPSGKGVVDVANNFLTFATLFLGFGLAASNIYFLGKNKDHLGAVIGNNLLVTLLTSVVLVPFYFLNARYQFQFLRGVTNLQMLMVLLSIPFVNFKASMVNVLLGMQEVVEYNRINVVDKILNVILLAALLLMIVSPSSAIFATLAGAMIISIWEMIILTKMGARPRIHYSLLKQMLGYGLKAQVGNIIQRLNYRLDVFIVNYFLPIGQVGIYGIAVALGETLWGVSGSIATIVFPTISASQDKKEMYVFTNQVTRISFTLIVIFSLILAAISKPLVIFWFGRSFTQASAALLWLLPGIAIFSVSNILANYLAGAGLVEKNIYSSIVSAIVTIVLDIGLIPRIGINGASIATSISYIMFTLTTLWFYIRYTNARWQDILIIKRSDLALIISGLKQKTRRT